MSRVVVLGPDNRSVGQFDAICSPGYTLDGNAAVSGGGGWTLIIPSDVAAQKWINLGRMVVVQADEDLPAYIGIIDTPWRATTPVQVTVYDAEYLLHLRATDSQVKYTGSADMIVKQIINAVNNLDDLYLRIGDIYEIDRTVREETLDTRPLWDQLQAFGLRSKTEFVFRPARGADGRWYIYLDLATQMGIDTGFLLSDGENGNMHVVDAQVRGEVVNRIIGINSASTPQSLLSTDALTDDVSIATYRMRSRVVQFRDVMDLNTLLRNAQNTLDAASQPYLELTVEVVNVNHAWRNLRPGNRVLVHASKIQLPGGVSGWRGITRILKMVYQETSTTIAMTLIGAL